MIRVHLPPHSAAPPMDNDVGDPDNTSDHPKGTRPRQPYKGAKVTKFLPTILLLSILCLTNYLVRLAIHKMLCWRCEDVKTVQFRQGALII